MLATIMSQNSMMDQAVLAATLDAIPALAPIATTAERARQANFSLDMSAPMHVPMDGTKPTDAAANALQTARLAPMVPRALSARMAKSWKARSATMFVQTQRNLELRQTEGKTCIS